MGHTLISLQQVPIIIRKLGKQGLGEKATWVKLIILQFILLTLRESIWFLLIM